MDLTITEISTIIGFIIALTTAVIVILEYKRQGTQRRAEFFSKKLNEMWKDDRFKKVWYYLDTNDVKNIKAIDREDKLAYLVMFDEIALMMNSGLIKKEVAYYMFGYFAMTCWDNEAFWSDSGIDRGSVYWSVLRNFVDQMKQIEATYQYEKKLMKF